MSKYIVIFLATVLSGFMGCAKTTSDSIQQLEQEKLLAEGTAQSGMPAIKNFRERKLAKMILELRDQENLITYTYLHSEQSGKLIYLGQSIGYGLPYATQYTNPMKLENPHASYYEVIPQADPNGLFSPASAEGTWVLLKDPNNKEVKPVYIEPRIVVSPFLLRGENIVDGSTTGPTRKENPLTQ